MRVGEAPFGLIDIQNLPSDRPMGSLHHQEQAPWARGRWTEQLREAVETTVRVCSVGHIAAAARLRDDAVADARDCGVPLHLSSMLIKGAVVGMSAGPSNRPATG